MLDKSLEFLRSELDTYIKSITGSTKTSTVLSPLFDSDGKSLLGDALLGMCLVNVEEERVNKAQQREAVGSGTAIQFLPPEVRLNLHVLVAANVSGVAADNTKYDQSLRSLSAAITFFQGHRVFSADEYPELPDGVKKLVLELETLDYEFQNHVWGTLGGKLTPSVMYRVRLVAMQMGRVVSSGKPITKKEALVLG
ncbi:DUF4255 domain-containing protein [Kordiimonas lacus]|uniref:Pvc16 N-terminal domain-containing protein n=1 Tax=Kordiimonas lacus TaxID=637679 RepID=A0A1G7A4K7_9PROT|nr:DUF4255 domain-containing protein [Kordiimonas lacus]SDE09701.1 Protein of unknown function [Kordiimonas lacus]